MIDLDFYFTGFTWGWESSWCNKWTSSCITCWTEQETFTERGNLVHANLISEASTSYCCFSISSSQTLWEQVGKPILSWLGCYLTLFLFCKLSVWNAFKCGSWIKLHLFRNLSSMVLNILLRMLYQYFRLLTALSSMQWHSSCLSTKRQLQRPTSGNWLYTRWVAWLMLYIPSIDKGM